MPLIDLSTPTQLLVQWGWFLVTRANGLVYILILVIFACGMFVRLPRAKRDVAAVEKARAENPGANRIGSGGAGDAA